LYHHREFGQEAETTGHMARNFEWKTPHGRLLHTKAGAECFKYP